MSNYNEYNNQNFNVNQEHNFVNLANSIDLDNLNGTNILDLNRENFNNVPINNMPNFNIPNNLPPLNNIPLMNNIINTEPFNNINSNTQNNSIGQDKHLIKSITRELINNLKENNISLHDDNTTYISMKNKPNLVDASDTSNNYDNYDNYENYDNYNKEGKKKKNKKSFEYKNDIKKGFEHMMSENGVPGSESLSSYIFDDLFNLKEFIILFGVYFLLSQEMIKDLFAQYFTSLNPDDTGKVNVKGVIIYGLILTILFMVLKKVI